MATTSAEKPARQALMSMADFWDLAERVIWPKSKRHTSARMTCDQCNEDAKSYEDPENRPGHSGRAPLLPIDFLRVCPEYEGKCPRCGGAIHDSLGA